jgi:hypothetical protein
MMMVILTLEYGKQKVPYKIKILLWLAKNGAILTKDNGEKEVEW